ncbi:ERO1-domain-containing protein [Aspergillus transmontanensis]|uniref:Peroxisomal membrane protein PEX13 n=1 Tax=Aspergillus transmontanensis TaxID=1034304 RepID=A0A5N6VKE0_9EURO|nr:ERO1-domain-containing protein [Aspergillus transmontanensis]
MSSAAKVFYLAVFAFLRLSNAESQHHGQDTCAIDPKATVSDACVSYNSIDSLNDKVYPLLQTITQDTDFFSYYRLNLFNKVCPFWSDENSMCGNIACSVTTIESEEDIPLPWRAEELSKLEGPKAGHPGPGVRKERPGDRPLQGMLGEDVGESCVVEYDDECDQRDYCVPEDEGASAKGDYVSLLDNPERFTGYAGMGAHQVWNAIYRENCFLKSTPEQLELSANPQFGELQAANDLRNVLQKELKRTEGLPLDNECLEKRVFHRVISGMHASISTHLCWDYFNQTTGQWNPNLQCFKERLHDHPERISNLYFNYALVSRAVAKLRKHLESYTYCTSDPVQDADTKEKVSLLTSALANRPQIFDENLMFQDPSAIGLKEDFRNRFRNVSRLMDCVGCDKCRLWGKLQVNGYGTALKVLFEYDETKNGENPPLRRTELVALINTLGRISHSVAAVKSFHRAMDVQDGETLTIPADMSSVKNPDGKTTRRLVKDGDDFQYLTEKLPWERAPRGENDGFLDELRAEFEVFWNTFFYVLRSWVNIPQTLFEIIVLEFNRLWSYWLGLPPWERAGATAGVASSAMTATAAAPVATTSATASTTSAAPDLPSRPNSLNTVVNRTASNYSPYGASRLGASPYGGYGGYGSYSSPYSRFGSMGSMYGGYGGYGGMYGGMGGMGGMYGGMPGDPNDPNSLTNSFSQSTQATFQMIESIVGAFGGFAQMLESTYMATHSSFFAMVSVAEQLGNLRTTLGSALGIYTMIRWFKTLIAKITGRPPPADATSLTPAAFAAFIHGRSSPATLPDGSPAPPKPSKKPFIMFLLAVFGLPYLMSKLIKSLARSQEERQKLMIGPNGEPVQQAPLDPSKLDFCRVLYDYTPETQETNGIDLAVKKGDIVAVLSKSDPTGNASEWWRCRARDGRVGYLPGPYLETIQRKPQQQAITSGGEASSRTNSMQARVSDEIPANEKKPELKGKMGDISPESFQKSAFYS